jgi:hypothetical protein
MPWITRAKISMPRLGEKPHSERGEGEADEREEEVVLLAEADAPARRRGG